MIKLNFDFCLPKKALALFLLLATVSLLFSSACRTTSSDGGSEVKVRGGTEDNQQHPSAVGLKVTFGPTMRVTCTGTFIRHDIVLTAAHCIKRPDRVNLPQVSVFDRSAQGHEAVSIGTSIFPGYDPSADPRVMLGSDLALIILPSNAADQSAIAAMGSTVL